MHITGLVHDKLGFPSNRSDTAKRLLNRLNYKVKEELPDFNINTKWFCGDARYLIAAYGSVVSIALSVGKRLREEGIKAGVFIPRVLWPFRETELDDILAGGVEIVFVAELNLGQYIHVIRSCANQYSIKTVACAKSSGEQFLVDELYGMVRGEIGL